MALSIDRLQLMYRLHSCNRYIANRRSGDAPGRGIEGLSCGRGNWCTANGQNHGRPKSPFGWPCFSFDDVAQQGQPQEYPDVPPHLGDELADSAHCGIDNLAHDKELPGLPTETAPANQVACFTESGRSLNRISRLLCDLRSGTRSKIQIDKHNEFAAPLKNLRPIGRVFSPEFFVRAYQIKKCKNEISCPSSGASGLPDASGRL